MKTRSGGRKPDKSKHAASLKKIMKTVEPFLPKKSPMPEEEETKWQISSGGYQVKQERDESVK